MQLHVQGLRCLKCSAELATLSTLPGSFHWPEILHESCLPSLAEGKKCTELYSCTELFFTELGRHGQELNLGRGAVYGQERCQRGGGREILARIICLGETATPLPRCRA